METGGTTYLNRQGSSGIKRTFSTSSFFGLTVFKTDANGAPHRPMGTGAAVLTLTDMKEPLISPDIVFADYAFSIMS